MTTSAGCLTLAAFGLSLEYLVGVTVQSILIHSLSGFLLFSISFLPPSFFPLPFSLFTLTTSPIFPFCIIERLIPFIPIAFYVQAQCPGGTWLENTIF